MQTILGSTGQIGEELAKALYTDFTKEIRLVSRHPKKIHETDEVISADLLDAQQTEQAILGSDIVYFTAGLPLDTERWINEFPVMIENIISACEKHKAKLVFFDNTYMYPQTSEPLIESTPFKPNGAKGKVRAALANMVLQAIENQRIEAMICRAPEFYGPGKTQSFTNFMVLYPLLAGKEAKVFLKDNTLRTLIYTPDASRAMALLGNTADAYNQTWHLPCDDNRLTYSQLIHLVGETFHIQPHYKILKRWQLWLAALFNKNAKDGAELLPRYAADNIFVSDKFKIRFPEFPVTSYEEGLKTIWEEKQKRPDHGRAR